MDSYKTLSTTSSAEYKDKGSRFIGYAYPVSTEEQIHELLHQLRKEHIKARHFCYAYRLGLDNTVFRANDDGEPSGTAGKPILGQIDSHALTNSFIVVVRYFGGTLLGTSGLIQAYRAAAAEAIAANSIIEKVLHDVYCYTFDYAHMPDVMQIVKKLELKILSEQYDELGKMHLAMRQNEVAEMMHKIKAFVLHKSLEEAETLPLPDAVTAEFVETIHL